MAKGDFLGEFEQIVMLAVLRLEAEAYGMEVRREIESRTGRALVFAAIDNLWKGAAGQAVQNLNLMLGLDETEGLR